MSADVNELALPLRTRVQALLLVANRDGVRVTVTSTRRSRDEQAKLYEAWRNGTGNLAAAPGTSKHETGDAIDFGGDLDLVAKLAPTFGLKATVPGEPWHYESAGGTALLSGGDATNVDSPADLAKLGAALASNPIDTLRQLLAGLLDPKLWLRVGAVLVGLVLLGVGAAMLTKGATP